MRHSRSPSVLAAGKLDLAFGLCRNAIAGCRAIPPSADGLENMAIASCAGALQNERAVDPAIDANDETHFDLAVPGDGSEQRIRSGQRLRRLNVLARPWRTHVRHTGEFGVARHSAEKLLALFKRLHARHRSSESSHCSRHQQKNGTEYATRHDSYLPRNVLAELLIANPVPTTTTRMLFDGNALQARSCLSDFALCKALHMSCGLMQQARTSSAYPLAARRRVRSVISGGQFHRMGSQNVPRPRLV